MDKVLKRLDLLEKRVNELEKQLSIIKQMEHSERVQKYIDNVERARKVTSLLETMNDNSGESVNVVMDKKVSEELRNEFDLSSLEDAHSYVEATEMMVAEEEKYLESIAEEKDWSEIFEYQKSGDGIVILRYIGFDEEEIVVPDKIEDMDVVEIGDGAFQNCETIKKVIFPRFLKRIGNDAFEDCGIDELDLPQNLVFIGENAFSNTKIRELIIPNGIDRIENYAFSACYELNKVIFPSGLKSIGQGAFLYCELLTKVDIPNNCKIIEDDAFLDDVEERKYLNIRIGNNVERIGQKLVRESVFGISKFSKSNITIYCKAGSYAMEYARKHKIPVKKYEEFEELD